MKSNCLDFQIKVSNTIVTTRAYILVFFPPHTRSPHRFNWVNQPPPPPPPPPPTGYVCSIHSFLFDFIHYLFYLLFLFTLTAEHQRFPNTPTHNLKCTHNSCIGLALRHVADGGCAA